MRSSGIRSKNAIENIKRVKRIIILGSGSKRGKKITFQQSVKITYLTEYNLIYFIINISFSGSEILKNILLYINLFNIYNRKNEIKQKRLKKINFKPLIYMSKPQNPRRMKLVQKIAGRFLFIYNILILIHIIMRQFVMILLVAAYQLNRHLVILQVLG